MKNPLKGYKAREVRDGEYEVLKPDGTVYNVRYCGAGDGDPDHIAVWDCDCPATRVCKHIRLVAELFSESGYEQGKWYSLDD